MLKYDVGFYFTNDDPKILKSFNCYEDAFKFYTERMLEEFDKLGRISASLKIGYILDGKLVGTEKFIMKNE